MNYADPLDGSGGHGEEILAGPANSMPLQISKSIHLIGSLGIIIVLSLWLEEVKLDNKSTITTSTLTLCH